VIVGLGFDYLHWFILGMLLYDRKVNQSRNLLSIFLISFFAISIDMSKQGISGNQIALVFVILLFLLFTVPKKQSRLIKFQVFQICGFSSYEMYLLHQGVGVPILYYIIKTLEISALPAFAVMLLVVIILFYLSCLLSSVTSKLNSRLRIYLLQNLKI
jgi:peptidoglycan/LPS O-acetylase OafA/YrhL